MVVYTINPSDDAFEQNLIFVCVGSPFILKKGQIQQVISINNFYSLKSSEIAQLQQQGAPIYVYQ